MKQFCFYKNCNWSPEFIFPKSHLSSHTYFSLHYLSFYWLLLLLFFITSRLTSSPLIYQSQYFIVSLLGQIFCHCYKSIRSNLRLPDAFLLKWSMCLSSFPLLFHHLSHLNKAFPREPIVIIHGLIVKFLILPETAIFFKQFIT